MTDLSEQFVDALAAALTTRLGGRGYVVEDREPLETELDARASRKQLFVVVPAYQVAEEENATQGESIRVIAPVSSLCVMRLPKDQTSSKKTREVRRLILDTFRRVRNEFLALGPDAEIRLVGEVLEFAEGYYVSNVVTEFTYSLSVED